MFKKKTIKDIDLQGKRVLVRVDFNVPLENGHVSDDTRIQAALPTIEYLLEKDTALILASHLGRPKGTKNPQLSLQPVAERLAEILEAPVYFVEECIGPKAKKAATELKCGEILVLENTRFHNGEKANDPQMAKQLASLAEIFVNDAFGTAHRSHASTVGVAAYLPTVAGFLMEKEIRYLGEMTTSPKMPYIAILGGAKVSGKIKAIRNLLSKADKILMGGGMANTFFKAKGYDMANSLVEEESIHIAKELLEKAGNRLYLPIDMVIANDFSVEAERKVLPLGDVPAGWQILDIGPETVRTYGEIIASAGTIIWNGPMGVFEFPPFAQGTFDLAKAVAESSAISIIGGGDSAAAAKQSGLAKQFTHISTGGGASLQMLEGTTLPGLAAIDDLD